MTERRSRANKRAQAIPRPQQVRRTKDSLTLDCLASPPRTAEHLESESGVPGWPSHQRGLFGRVNSAKNSGPRTKYNAALLGSVTVSSSRFGWMGLVGCSDAFDSDTMVEVSYDGVHGFSCEPQDAYGTC